MGKPTFAVGFLFVTSVLAILLAGTYDVIRGGTADDQQSNAERSSPEDQPQAASMYPGLIGAARMDPDGVRDEIAALAPSKTHYWEVGHAARAAAGTSTELPFGETPYQAPFAVTSCYHAETQTVAWANHLGEVWVRSADRAASLLWRAQTAVLVKRIAFRADGHELLVVDSDGHLHFIPTVPAGEVIERVVRTGLAAPMVACYSESVEVVMVWRAEKSVIETWGPDDQVGPSGVRPQRDIDFACLSARPGYLGFARRSDGNDGQPARFEVIDPHGQLACKVSLPIAGRVTAFDYHADLQRLFVGTSNGHILCFTVPDGRVAWSTYLGFSTPVAAVLAVPDEGRVFASMGQVHLLGLEDGTLIDQLGNPEEQAVGVARLYWDAERRSITSCSPVAVHRWAAD